MIKRLLRPVRIKVFFALLNLAPTDLNSVDFEQGELAEDEPSVISVHLFP